MTRVTVSDAYQNAYNVLMAQATRPHAEPTSDVEITRNAKGDWQFKVAVTGRDPDAAHAKACELADALAEKYPYSNGTPAEPPTADDEKERAANQALRGRIAAQRGRAK